MSRAFGRSGSITERRPRASKTPEHNNSDSQARPQSELTANRWPEVRIVRKVLYKANSVQPVREFVDNFGDRNLGVGEAKTLGSMAMTFVDSQAMGRMLAKKFRRSFDTRKGTLQVVRSFAKDYNQFVGRDEQKRVAAANVERDAKRLIDPSTCLVVMPDAKHETGHCIVNGFHGQTGEDWQDGDILIRDMDDVDLDEDILTAHGDLKKRRWNQGDFPVRPRLAEYGDKGLGFDLSDVDQLYEEFEATEEYLRKVHKLDTSHMLSVDQGEYRFVPHVQFFRTFGPPGMVALSHTVEHPSHIPLASPLAIVNPNQPNLL